MDVYSAFLTVLGILAGMMVLVQSPVNTNLGKHIGSPLAASLVSFSVGLAFLLALCVFTGGGLPADGGSAPWWSYTGGICGAAIVFSFIILYGKMGAVRSVVLPLTGMLVAGTAIDHFGLLGAEVRPLTGIGALGLLMVAAGMAAVVTLRHRNGGKTGKRFSAGDVLWCVFGTSVGAVMAVQAAINGHLGMCLGSALQSSFVSFAVGTCILSAAYAVGRLSGNIRPVRKGRIPPWMLTGGILGSAYVFMNCFLVPEIGTGTTVALTITGQMIGSVIIDNLGLLNTEKKHTGPAQIASLALVLAGSILAKMFRSGTELGCDKPVRFLEELFLPILGNCGAGGHTVASAHTAHRGGRLLHYARQIESPVGEGAGCSCGHLDPVIRRGEGEYRHVVGCLPRSQNHSRDDPDDGVLYLCASIEILNMFHAADEMIRLHVCER